MAGLDPALEEAAADLGATPVAHVPAGHALGTDAGDHRRRACWRSRSRSTTWSPRCSCRAASNSPLPVVILGMIRFRITPEINAIGLLVMLFTVTLMSFAVLIYATAGVARAVRPRGGSMLDMYRGPMSDAAVDITGVEKRFGDLVAVRHLDLRIEPGEFFSIIGPSGCGKTTTLRMIAGFEDPTAGRISGRRPGHDRRAALPAAGQHGVSELRAVPSPRRVREHRLRPARGEGRQGRGAGAGRRGREPGAARGPRARRGRGSSPAASNSGSRSPGRW